MPAYLGSVLAAAALLTLTVAVVARDTVSFDFGWKHRTGLTSWDAPDSQPPPNPDPGPDPPEASPDYDAADWADVTLPHDGLIAASPSEAACPDGCSGKSYLPRHVLWYRKTFTLPKSWEGSVVYLDFEGSFRNTTVWVNGHLAAKHVCGYTPIRLRVDDLPSVLFGSPIALAVFVDPDNGDSGGPRRGSGWWYEGGGLYRPVHLIRTNPIRVEPDGLFAKSHVDFGDDGDAARSASLQAQVTVANSGAEATEVCVSVRITAPDGSPAAATSEPARVAVEVGGSATASLSLSVPSPKLWSAREPALYGVTATLADCSHSGDVDGESLDSVRVTHGFRHLRHDADGGFFLNREHFKVRGFCDHNNFAVVGMAVPDRINLYRAQASRAVGGNGRRTSHNPPNPMMLEIYDRLGIVVMDENRLFDDNPQYVENMGVLVKRDRNHPSVVIWSFCNEVDCEGTHEKGGPAFQTITTQYDGTRPTLANMFTFNDMLSNTVDVQGFSHQSREKLDDCHAALPQKPIYMSECCSCNTMRDEDVGCETLHDNPHNNCTQMAFNARCLESNYAVNASDGVDYAVGTMVWTLFDYYGEPPMGGPEISSTYGQYDLCGFPKASAFWFRMQWLLSIPDGRPDKTFPTHSSFDVHIVESWESPDSWPATKGNSTRTIHAYSNAPFVELFVNDKSQGSLPIFLMGVAPGSYAEWTEVPWESGKLTAVARSADGRQLAKTHRFTNGPPQRLTLHLDVPSKATGTGEAVLLDGQDAALVRASVVDAAGKVLHLATHNITFAVVSGPGVVQGTGNGDPRCHEPNNAAWHSAYHGLVRAVVRTTSVAAWSHHERALLHKIDHDGPMVATGLREKSAVVDESDIIVEASSPGFDPVRLKIPTSLDPSTASVLAVAQAGAGKPVNFLSSSEPLHDKVAIA